MILDNIKNIPKSIQKMAPAQRNTAVVLAVIILVIILGAWYSQHQINKLSDGIASLSTQLALVETKLSSTTVELKENINKTQDSLAQELEQSSSAIDKKISKYQKEVNQVSGTVEDLQKLSKTDPELLAKYSKVFFLNEYYAPARLTEIPNEYLYSDTKVLKVHAEVWPHLQDMIDAAKKDGVPIYVFSAFRSFNEQSALKTQYKVTYGAGSANQFSADQGYSEHQLGTTVDLITTGLGGALEGFDNTSAYTWLVNNAYKYGFVLSYPKGNNFYVFEPWHWRFVGTDLAEDLHDDKKSFYDLDQREIDEYLIDLF